MKDSLQTVKEFSPLGWGITVLVLILDMYNTRNPAPSVYTKDIEDLKVRVTMIENLGQRVASVEFGVRDLQASMKELKKIGCSSLTRSQKSVVTSCED